MKTICLLAFCVCGLVLVYIAWIAGPAKQEEQSLAEAKDRLLGIAERVSVPAPSIVPVYEDNDTWVLQNEGTDSVVLITSDPSPSRCKAVRQPGGAVFIDCGLPGIDTGISEQSLVVGGVKAATLHQNGELELAPWVVKMVLELQ